MRARCTRSTLGCLLIWDRFMATQCSDTFTADRSTVSGTCLEWVRTVRRADGVGVPQQALELLTSQGRYEADVRSSTPSRLVCEQLR